MDIQAKMGAIFERVIPEEWRREISGIAKKASQIFANNLRGAHREDELIELVYEAFRTMNDDETFDFPRKAGNGIPSTPLNKSLCLKADDFLKVLQREQKLCSDPMQNFLNVRFPILVIEGKAYATGKTVFEAQNQAAVSGCCMVNLQQQLTDLFEGVFSNPRGGKTPLAFSICTEGPHIEFWVHYTCRRTMCAAII